MAVKGMDISYWQGNLSLDNWRNINESDVDFAILRCAFTGYGKSKSKVIDKYFENNYLMAKTVGMPVGVYYYSCATTVAEALEEADFVLNLIKDKQLEYPVYYDVEDNHDTSNPDYAPENQVTIGKTRLTEVVKAFCNRIEEAGYYVGIYASSSWFKNQLILNDLKKYDKWVAQWSNSKPTISLGMWQYTSSGSVNGIYGNVDLNYAYIDYPQVIKDAGLNNFEIVNEPVVPDKPEVEEPDIPVIPDKPEVEEPNIPVVPDKPEVEEPNIPVIPDDLNDNILDEIITPEEVKSLLGKLKEIIVSAIKNIINMFLKR